MIDSTESVVVGSLACGIIGSSVALSPKTSAKAPPPADAMVAICQSRVHPSPPNDASQANGRWQMIDSTESVVIGSLLVG